MISNDSYLYKSYFYTTWIFCSNKGFFFVNVVRTGYCSLEIGIGIGWWFLCTHHKPPWAPPDSYILDRQCFHCYCLIQIINYLFELYWCFPVSDFLFCTFFWRLRRYIFIFLKSYCFKKMYISYLFSDLYCYVLIRWFCWCLQHLWPEMWLLVIPFTWFWKFELWICIQLYVQNNSKPD